MLRRAPLHLLLALLLLLAQQLAAAHGVAHHDEGFLPDHACQLCATSAQLGTGLTSSAPALAIASPALERQPCHASSYLQQFRPGFRSRAPPSAPL